MRRPERASGPVPGDPPLTFVPLLRRKEGSPDRFHIGADPNQLGRLHADVEMVRTHPLIAGRAQLGGFLYNVDSGLLEQHV